MKKSVRNAALSAAIIMLLCMFPMTASASNGKTEVIGKVYEFDKDSHYEFHEGGTSEQTAAENTYGTFYISGNIAADSEKSGVPAYEVSEGNLEFYYNHGNTMLNADEDSWHLVDDKSKEVADIELASDIMKGAFILQTSKDRKNWVDVKQTDVGLSAADHIYNAFGDTPIRTDPIYSTTDMQLNNGCYYRIIVVYKLAIRTRDSNFLFINTDKYDYKKCAEVYEFYAYTNSGESNVVAPEDGYRLGDAMRVKEHDGYFGKEEMQKGDPHYADDGIWKLGDFFVSGHTDKVVENNGNVVFLKNVGDKVTLWFDLEQNIDALNGNEKLSITADTNGHDQYFGTGAMNFGRGTLIIRYTDHNNKPTSPTIYTNYLEANTSADADTIVRLCEEGDYEVALDYEVTSDELIDKVGHYRIFFTFSVRNSNCMVYPFDVVTGSELANGSITESGFKLNYANSHYLKVNVKREVLKEGADGLVEDTRINHSAKDGAEYTDEGIYIITVKNQYTGESTTKKIYVGSNNILRAYMWADINNKGYSVADIVAMVEQGATISDDGTIQLATVKPIEPVESEKNEPAEEEPGVPSSSDVPTSTEPQSEEEPDVKSFPVSVLIVILATILCAVGLIIMKKKKQRVETGVVNHDDEGGADQ